MMLEPYEEKAYNKLKKQYSDFYDCVAKYGKECYRKDVHTIYPQDVKELTDEQKEEIYKYWKKYTDDFDIGYHRYYIDRTGNFDVRYIPDDLYSGYIDRYLNNRQIEPGIADKNYFDLYLKGFPMPKTLLHLINGIFEDENYNLINYEKALDCLIGHDVFIKPSMASYGGRGAILIKKASKEELENFFKNNTSKNLIFQERVNQSKKTAKMHPESVNTIRVMTLLIDGDVKVLGASYRMGVGNEPVDNTGRGGIYCNINDDGSLSKFASDDFGKMFEKHPDGGKFGEIKFDFLDKVYDLTKNAAQRFAHFRLIGWDIAIDENDEPVIIEANLCMSGLEHFQTLGAPVFGKYTDQVLDEVFNNEKEEISMDIIQYI